MREIKLYYPHSQSFCTLDIQTDICDKFWWRGEIKNSKI